MIDLVSIAALLGYGVKDLTSLISKIKQSRAKKKLMEHAEKVKDFAYDAAVCRLLGEYYSGSAGTSDLQRYRVRVAKEFKETAVFSTPDRTGMKVPSSEVDCGLETAERVAVPLQVRDLAPTVIARLDQLDVKVTNDPMFRLLKASLIGPELSFRFGTSSFCDRFTTGLLEDELRDSLALHEGNIERIMHEPSRALPVREALLPNVRALTSFSSRICAGGAGTLFAMARREPHNDFIFPVQTRSDKVADGRGLLAVLPKGTHAYGVDPLAEVGIESTIYRELAEEIYGEKEAEGYGTRLKHDWYFKLPGLGYFREHEGAFTNEIVGFGLNSLSGNFEFSGEMKGMWEYTKVELVSTKNPARIQQLLMEGNWASESVFHLVEGLIRLHEIEPRRVDLPDIGRELVKHTV
jgi:hypothetical protein